MTSAAHQPEDVDETIDMFDDLAAELVRQKAIPRL
jgi:hypothetical protein